VKTGKDNGSPEGIQEPKEKPDKEEHDKIRISPLARKLMEDENLSVDDIINGIRRITRNDVSIVSGLKDSETSFGHANVKASRESSRQKMSLLRRKLSVRLVAVKNETAMLTTFNEVDMSKIMELRQKYQSRFVERHGVKLGFMSVFAKAVTETLKLYPNINSYLENDDIITPQYIDIGIAVQTEKGLMVPVLRNTEVMGLADIEKNIITLAEKARKNRISIEDMSGGTFTITNGGVFGSLLSTPILNPPQSAILGMHNIVERPVAIKGKVEIRPMMYIALSYDHRIIDGKDSVGFLVKVKEMLEDPVKLVFRGQNPEDMLLDL
jgi:2-oxoglutarate dehydrogenase E2 component (dihydrolipoamide succinyltransferase)